MKYFNTLVLTLILAGCVQADTPLKFKSELIAEPSYPLRRVIDTELNVVCYQHSENLFCVKL